MEVDGKMETKQRKRKFDDPIALNLLLDDLRQPRPNYNALARKYKVDHTSILLQAKKRGLWVRRKLAPKGEGNEQPSYLSSHYHSHRKEYCKRCGMHLKLGVELKLDEGGNGIHCGGCLNELGRI